MSTSSRATWRHEFSDAAGAPVYSVYETYLGRGIVGGYMDSFVAIGEATARIGLRILAGASPESLPPEDGPDPGLHGRLAAVAPMAVGRSEIAAGHDRPLRAVVLMGSVPPARSSP